MPYIAPLLYHADADLHVVFDFLGRCEPDDRHMVANYQEERGLHAAQAACSRLDISMLQADATGRGNADPDLRLRLRVSWSDWHALSKNVLSMLAGELRLLFQMAGDAAEFVRHGNNRYHEVASSLSLLRHHFSLMLKLGLQILASGDVSPLPDMCWALAGADKAPLMVKLHGLLQTRREYSAACAPGHDPFQGPLTRQCMATFRQWQPGRMPLPNDAARSSGMHQATSSAFSNPSAFGHMDPDRHASGPGILKRKRDEDDLSGGDAKRVRIGPEGQNPASLLHAIPAETPGHALSATAPVFIDMTVEQPMFRRPGSGLFRHPGPDQAINRDAQRKAWRAAVGAPVNEHAMRRSAGSTIRVPDARAHGGMTGPTPASIQIVNCSIFQDRGPRL